MNTFANIQAARDFLLANGYVFVCYGAMTGASMWKNGEKVVSIRRKAGQVVVA